MKSSRSNRAFSVSIPGALAHHWKKDAKPAQALTLGHGVIQSMLLNKTKLGGLTLAALIFMAAIGALSSHLPAGEGQLQKATEQTAIAGLQPMKVEAAGQDIGGTRKPKRREELRAAVQVSQSEFLEGVNLALQITFSLHNDSAKVINPKVRYSKIIVNGKALPDSAKIFGSGPPTDKFDALQPGDELRFGYAMGKYFSKPGIYRVSWEGDGYASPAIVIWVQPNKRQ
jgi:hypothetical protein